MAEYSWPFASQGVEEADWYVGMPMLADAGVGPSYLNDLEAYADSSGMNVKMKTGRAFVWGSFYLNDAEIIKTVANSHATLDRIDLLVIRLDLGSGDSISVIIQGTPAGSPTAPTATVVDIPIAQIAVDAAVVQIDAGDITDARTYTGINRTQLNMGANTQNIATGAITVTLDAGSGEGAYALDTEGAAATDNLDNISGASAGDVLLIKSTNGARMITVRDGIGNIQLPGSNNVNLDTEKWLMVVYDGSVWRPVQNEITVGRHTVGIAASALTPETTSGCAFPTRVELTAGRPEVVGCEFTNGVNQYAFIKVPFPKRWNKSTLSFKPRWTKNSVDAGNVKWSFAALAVGDGDSIDQAYGTAVTSVDTGQATVNLEHVGPETAVATVAGTPVEGDSVYIQVGRKGVDAADTGAVPVTLTDFDIYWVTDEETDD